MKFLIDECLHTSLVRIAAARGHEATHVSLMGLSGARDRDLMAPILASGSIFVTNNAKDFRRLFAMEDVHYGLLVLIPNVTPSVQRSLFDAGLDSLEEDGDLTSQAMEIRFVAGEVLISRFTLQPKSDPRQR